MRSGSLLERVLRDGRLALTAELGTSDSADPEDTRRRARNLRGTVHAVNCTDNTGAHVHLASWAAARLLLDEGVEPVMQLACRDRNRLALQADLLGAAALGVRNVVMMSGDDVTGGDHPEAHRVYEIDSTQLVRTACIMRDQGQYLSGRPLTGRPAFFVGAVENPFAPPFEWRPHRLAKKVEAGADFVQTQLVYNLPRFRDFMQQVRDLGLLERTFVIASIGIPRSARAARFMREQVPGLDVPEDLVARLERTPASEQAEEGLRIAANLVEQVRAVEGVAGLHLIAIRWEEGIVRLVERMGLTLNQQARAVPAATRES